MTLRSPNPGQEAILHQENLLAEPKRQYQRRLRLVFRAIYFTKILVSLPKKDLESQSKIMRSQSYVAIDVHNDTSPRKNLFSSITVDQRSTLTDMVKERSLESLKQLGGVMQVAAILVTDTKAGAREADVAHRREFFDANRFKKPPAKSLPSFVLEAFKDMTVVILLVGAIMSLVFGIKNHGIRDGWFDGGSIVFAVILLGAISAVTNFKQSKQFEKLSDESSDINVQVVRDGRHRSVSIFDVVVGDVVSLKTGDQIPADGLFLDGYSLKLDESSMTGESDHVEVNCSHNPFLRSGTKVTDGFGFMLVTSVGMKTTWGEMMSSKSPDLHEKTPWQARVNKFASYIGKVGSTVAVLVLVVLMIRYFTGNTRDDNGRKEYVGSKTKVNDVLDTVVGIVAAAVTIVVVAIPEGLPLAVTVTLAYSMKRMMKDNAMVRKLSACETMGSATTICTDTTGTLTLNRMNVTEFWLGKEMIEADALTEIEPEVYQLLQEGVALNTTGTVNRSQSEITASPTEKAILYWAVMHLGMDINETKGKCEIIHVETFNSEKKRSGVLMRKNNEKAIHTHWKGAAEMILDQCSTYYVKNGALRDLNDEEKVQFEAIIRRMAAKSHRCIAFAHKKVVEENSQASAKLDETGMTFMGLVGLTDPCRPGVREAVESCKNAGVNVKMITGDHMHRAKAIAIECGILNPEEDMENGAVVEGVQFRKYSPEERMAKIDEIQVMARSSPSDKLLMVQCLKDKGEVVAVTGSTNDVPALKVASIGLSMGIQGTQVAKESSDIVILEDSFTTVVTVLRWGRRVNNSILKLIEFQLTMNLAALFINLVSAISFSRLSLAAFQILWKKIIMHTLWVLTVVTHDQPTDDLMTVPPARWSKQPNLDKLLNNLLAQVSYQAITLLTLQFKVGKSIFGVEVSNTLIFNTSVLCQVFNLFNARVVEKKRLFFMSLVIVIFLQVVMMELSNKVRNGSLKLLDWKQWCVSISIAALSWLFDKLVKLMIASYNRFFST